MRDCFFIYKYNLKMNLFFNFKVEFLPRQETLIKSKVKKEGLYVVLVFGGKDRRETVPSTCTHTIINIKTSHSNHNRVVKQSRGRKIHMATGTASALIIIKEIIKVEVQE
jgi:hypothetical protein